MESSPSPTRLCELVSVVIRLFSIRLGLEAFTFLLTTIGSYTKSGFVISAVFGLLILMACAYWLWQLSPRIARHVTCGQDFSLDFGSLTLNDLYCFAFLLVGLYFAVDSLGPSLTWLHYSLRESSTSVELSTQQKTNFYTLFKYLIKLLLGLALIFRGRKFADRLIKHQNEEAKSL